MSSFQPPPPERFIEKLRSRIYEGGKLNPYDARAVAVPIWVQLSAASNRGTATFRLPRNLRFRIRQLLPHVRQVVAETSVTALGTTLGVAGDALATGGLIEDNIFMKGQNCRLDIRLASGKTTLSTQPGFSIADLMACSGRPPGLLDTPLILMSGSTIELSAALQDIAASAAGVLTEYGFVAVGSLIRSE